MPSAGGLGMVRDRLEQAPALLRLGPEAILYAIMDQVVDEYAPVVAGLENDIDEIEVQLFKDDPVVSRLSRVRRGAGQSRSRAACPAVRAWPGRAVQAAHRSGR